MVTLGEDVAEALPAFRAQAESMMTDTVHITRGDAAPVFDETTGTYISAATTIYSGPARLKLSSTVVSDLNVQGQLLAQQGPRLDLPVTTSGGVRPGDIATVTASQTDPVTVGVRLTIAGTFVQTLATARRFPVEVQT